jgi:uroporphyrinogen decarboxylase
VKPNFQRFRVAVTREGIPDRIPLAEVGVDIEVMEAFLGRQIDSIETYASFWEKAGYDYALLGVRGQPIHDSFQLKIAEGQLTSHSLEKTVSTYSSARVKDEETFDSYPWIGAEDVYYKDVDLIRDHLSDGMKLVVGNGPIFQSLFRIMGVETLTITMFENPSLIRAMADQVGELNVNIVESLLQREWVGAIWYGDDMAYTTGLLVSPGFLREYIFPYLKRIGDLCKQYDKPFIFHSDGNLEEILEDLIDCRVQAVHPNEPQSVDMAEMKKHWGNRLSLMGGIDLDLLSTGTPQQVIEITRSLIDSVGTGGGVALGSSNSVAKYVPVANYKAMLETVLKFG